MVQRTQPEPSSTAAPQGETARSDGDDLEVEPVATLSGDASRTIPLSPAARVERLRRLALELQVDALETELDRARRRQDAVIERYEQVLAEREDDEDAGTPIFSWLTRD